MPWHNSDIGSTGKPDTMFITTGDPLGQWKQSPTDWVEYKLWGLAEYVNGRAFKPSDFSDAGLDVIKITELKFGVSDATARYAGPFEKKHLLQSRDLLFAWSGNPETSLDAFRWRGQPALLNQHIFRVFPREGIDKDYVYFLLKFMRPTFIRTARDKATSMGHVKVSDLKRLVARIPPLSEQKALARLLGTLDDKIELNRRMNETLEAMAQAIFKSWFVDFDPIRAKHALSKVEGAEGRDSGLPKPIADLFPDRFEDSELGEIPATWGATDVGALAEVMSGKRPPVRFSESNDDARVPLWGGNGPMGFVATPLYESPILLTGRVGTLGSVFRITSPCWPSDNTLLVLARDQRSHEFLYFQLKQVDFASLNRGSTQPLLTQTDLKAQKFALPSEILLDRFHGVVGNLFAHIDALRDESRTLTALRDALLPKLLSGELRVDRGSSERELL